MEEIIATPGTPQYSFHSWHSIDYSYPGFLNTSLFPSYPRLETGRFWCRCPVWQYMASYFYPSASHADNRHRTIVSLLPEFHCVICHCCFKAYLKICAERGLKSLFSWGRMSLSLQNHAGLLTHSKLPAFCVTFWKILLLSVKRCFRDFCIPAWLVLLDCFRTVSDVCWRVFCDINTWWTGNSGWSMNPVLWLGNCDFTARELLHGRL